MSTTGTIPASAPVGHSNEVSATRLYLGNLPKNATKSDIEQFFGNHGTGEILEIKLMNGFGFIEYKDAMDARDIVPAYHGTTFMGERLTVQFARGPRPREPNFHNSERAPPRPRRTTHRMNITGLPPNTSWQDLKDFVRDSGLDVVYSETNRSGDSGYVEFETAQDLTVAIDKMNNKAFNNKDPVICTAAHVDAPPFRDMRGRSRSPPPLGRRPYPPMPRDDYDRRGPPPPRAGYSPRKEGGYRDGYRDRSPRRYYDEPPARYPQHPSPPSRRGPMDDYPMRRFDDPYRRDYPPMDPYAPRPGPYDRPPPPRDFAPRAPGYPRDDGYGRNYDDRRYY